METWFLLYTVPGCLLYMLLLPFPDQDKKVDTLVYKWWTQIVDTKADLVWFGFGTLSHEEIHSAHGQMCRNNQLDPGSIYMLIGNQLEINVHGHAHGEDIHAHGQDGHAHGHGVHTQGHPIVGSSLDTETQNDTDEYYYIVHPLTSRVLDVSDEGEVIMANKILTKLSQQWRNESGILINKQSGLALHVQQQSLTLTKLPTESLSTWNFYKNNFIVNNETDHHSRLLETNGFSVSITFNHPIGTIKQKWDVRPVTGDERPGLVPVILVTIMFEQFLPLCFEQFSPTKCPELFEKEEDIKEFEKFENHPEYPECWEDIKPSFKLFTKTKNCIIADAKTELLDLKSWNKTCSALDELKAMEGLRKIVFITHGFIGKSATGEWPVDMANLIIKHDVDVAVVTVDWSEGAAVDPFFFYFQPAANTRYVGIATARIVDQLRKLKPKAKFHCIGHSLGAHICGFVGKETAIDRISGMDPAGPYFSGSKKEERLHKTDAKVVDVLHTDGDTFGLMNPIGHIDFYAGKDSRHYGANQKGCDSYIPMIGYVHRPLQGSVCDHSRSHEIYKATIANRSCTPGVGCLWYKDATLTACQVSKKQPRIGYWYQGGFTGLYGFIPKKDKPYC